jgi:hypothetical protein
MTCQKIGGSTVDGGADGKLADGPGADAASIPDAAKADARQFDARIDAGPLPDVGDGGGGGVAPVVTFTDRTSQCVKDPIVFSADVEATFTCSIDDGPFAPCMSPFALPMDLAGSGHSLTVHAVGVGGASSDTTLTFTIDKTGPVVTIDGTVPPADMSGVSDASGTITFHSDGTAVSYTCLLGTDVSAATDCTPSSGDMGSFAYGPLSDHNNPFSFSVVGFDSCGNPSEPATLALNVDSTGPTICVTDLATSNGFSMSVMCNGGSDAVSGSSGSIFFSGESTATYMCFIDGASVIPCMPGTAVPFSGLGLGEHRLDITGTDLHHNTSMLTFIWNVDTLGPIFTITKVITTPNTGRAEIDYFANEQVPIVSCNVDGLQCQTCTNLGAVCGGLSAGDHTFTVSGIDQFGNQGPPASTTFTITFGPNQGRAIVIGHDFPATLAADPNEAAPIKILRNAVVDVPYKFQGVFNRPVRIVGYRGGMESATEVANAKTAIAGLYDTGFYHEFSDPNTLATNLVGADVLLIYDQQDPPSSREACDGILTVGELWVDQLSTYLNEGGVVIVLDGLTSYLLEGPPSQTQMVLNAGNCTDSDSLFELDNARDLTLDFNLGNIGFEDDLIHRIDDLNNLNTSDTPTDLSSLSLNVGASYDPPENATVWYQDNDYFFAFGNRVPRARDVFAPEPCQQCETKINFAIDAITALPPDFFRFSTVAEKIFPGYDFFQTTLNNSAVNPNAPLGYEFDPEVPYDTIHCTAAMTFCEDPSRNRCLCGGAFNVVDAGTEPDGPPGHAQTNCTCAGGPTPDGGNFALPFTGAGDYRVAMRVIDPWGRPGNAAYISESITINEPNVEFTGQFQKIGGDAGTTFLTYCYTVSVNPNRNLNISQTLNGIDASVQAGLNPGCLRQADDAGIAPEPNHSFTFPRNNFSCDRTLNVRACDNFNNCTNSSISDQNCN